MSQPPKFIPEFPPNPKEDSGWAASLICSALLHSLLLGLLFVGMHQDKKAQSAAAGQKAPEIIQVELVEDLKKAPEKPPQMETEMIIDKPNKTPLKEDEERSEQGVVYKVHKTNDNKCLTWFGGIGVEVLYQAEAPGSGFILETVYHGYPAEQAGLEPGDRIIDVGNTGDIRGKPGTSVTFEVVKKGSNDVISMELIRDKICTQK